MKDIKDVKFSLIKNNHIVVGAITLEEYVAQIKTSSQKVIDYRTILPNDPKKAEKIKRSMSGVTPAGLCDKLRSNDTFIESEYSGVLQIDIDKIDKQSLSIDKLKIDLAADKFVCVVHKSVSSNGLVVFIRIDSGAEMHSFAVAQVTEYIAERYKVKVDPSCKDISRQRYFSYDPEIYHNPKADEFHVFSEIEIRNLKKVHRFTDNKLQFEEGNRNNYIYQLACNANRQGIDQKTLQIYAETYFESIEFTQKEIIDAVKSGYSHVGEYGTSELSEESDVSETFASSRSELFADTPCFEDQVFRKLPDIFKFIIDIAEDNRERDVMMMGFIGILSSIFPNVSGIHSSKRVYPNLYGAVYAPAGAGKGKLGVPKEIGMAIHNHLKEKCQRLKQDHRIACAACRKDDSCLETPPEPSCKSLFIKGDISTSALKNYLQASDMNIIYEMESYVLSKNKGKDWANSEDVFLNSWEHEAVGKSRVDDADDAEVEDPKLSIVVSGTPSMLEGLIPSVDSGFFSRTCFYVFSQELKWKDQFSEKQDKAPQVIELAKTKLEEIFNFTRLGTGVSIRLSSEQRKIHNDMYSAWTEDLKQSGLDREYFASIARSGRVFFRLVLILSAIRRFEEKNTSAEYVCHDSDFAIVKSLCITLNEHSKKVFLYLSKFKSKSTAYDNKTRLFNALPGKFSRQNLLELAESLAIEDSERTIDEWLKGWNKTEKVIRTAQGKYLLAKTAGSSKSSK